MNVIIDNQNLIQNTKEKINSKQLLNYHEYLSANFTGFPTAISHKDLQPLIFQSVHKSVRLIFQSYFANIRLLIL